METNQIYVHKSHTIDRIAPEIFGYFAEHLGRCIYNGIWVGLDAEIPHTDGIRDDTIELLRELDPPIVRWPGGCFAEDYFWEDGIGPREDRPRRRNIWWAQSRPTSTDVVAFEESNDYGTDEFIQTCDLLDTKPYIVLNVGTGTAREAMNWVEYCNSSGETAYAEKRRQNGSEDPYEVVYWGIGNETYGCGGDFSPDDYGQKYRRYATFLRGLERAEVTNNIELVACGFRETDWNQGFLEAVTGRSIFDHAQLVDHISIHRYVSTKSDTEFSEDDYYQSLAECEAYRADINRVATTLEEFAPNQEIGIVVDEWGLWHPEATFENGLEQKNTVRDGIAAATILNIFNTHADKIVMANLAQVVNVLQSVVQTNETEAWTTPTYHVFRLYKPHMGATALRTTVEKDVRSIIGYKENLPYINASASVKKSELFVTLNNCHYAEQRTIHIDAGDAPTEAEAQVLFADHQPQDFSTPDNADSFEAEKLPVDIESDGVYVDAPPASVVATKIHF